MATVLITGVNRGIGLGLLEAYLKRNAKVIGSARDIGDVKRRHAHEISAGRLRVLSMDVTVSDSIAAAARSVDEPIDILINNAGVVGPKHQSTLDMDFAGFAHTFEVNTLGPLRVAQAFLPHLKRGRMAKIVTISSGMGSMSYASSDRIAYRASKAAVNKVMQGLSTDLKPFRIAVASIHPGWVRSDMGGSSADITVEESAKGIISVIDRLTPETTGRFFDWNGAQRPW